MSEIRIKYNKKTELLRVYCHRNKSHLVKRIGALQWEPNLNCWLLGFTVFNIQALIRMFGDLDADNLTLKAIEKLLENEEKVKEILKNDDLFCNRSFLCKIGVLSKPKEKSLRIPGFKGVLKDFQKRGVSFLLKRGSGLLSDDMGLGKTVQSIAFAMFLKKTLGIKKCLVVCPSNVKYNWRDEIINFTDEDYTIVEGSPKKRIELWESKTFFKIISYGTLISDLGMRKVGKKKSSKRTKVIAPVNWGAVFLDEAHRIKSRNSVRSNAVKILNAKHRVALTGTPLDGSLLEFHSIFEFVQLGVFPSLTSFKDKFCRLNSWGGIEEFVNEKEFNDRARTYYIRRMKEEVLTDLPPKRQSKVYIELSTKERKLYDKYKDEALNGDVKNKLALVTRFKQICNSPELVGEDITSSKLEILTELIDDIVMSGNKIIVFSHFVQMCEIIARYLKTKDYGFVYIKGGVSSSDRNKFVKRFNTDDEIPILLSSDAGSEGLNCQGASYVIHYDDLWSPAAMAQRTDRAHRMGQLDTVNVISFVTVNTIEERVIEVLDRKLRLQKKFLSVIDETSFIKKSFTLDELKELI